METLGRIYTKPETHNPKPLVCSSFVGPLAGSCLVEELVYGGSWVLVRDWPFALTPKPLNANLAERIMLR